MVTMKVKRLFFDSARVVRAVDAATRRALSRAGAFIRRRAQTSIRRRKGISKPGRPPHSHEGTLRRLIYFSYGPATQTVVIGPVAHGVKERRAPHLLEFGGTTSRRVWNARRQRLGRRRSMRYRKRPFMGPALAAEVPQLPSRWANSVRG